MKGAVAYDSILGNTKLVAEAIADQIRSDGHTAEIVALRQEGSRRVEADFMFVGGPTRLKKMTRPVKRFVKKQDIAYWSTRPIVVFDTYGPIPKTEEERIKGDSWINPGAAGGIRELAIGKGLKVHPVSLRLAVTDLKGPLEPESLDKARKFTHEFIVSLGK